MTTTLLRLEADMDNSLAAAVSVGATSATLSSSTNADGDTYIAGKYGLTIDGDNSAKEFIVCDLSGTALTNVLSVDLQGNTTSGFVNYHRIGATVTITDWVILQRMYNNLTGTTGFNSATPLQYDAQPDTSDPLTIPTVQFVLDTASGGTVTFNRQIISGNAGETVAAGDWVYLNTTDGEWYLTDADDTTKCLNVQIGKAIGAGTNGNPIDGGIFISGTETVGTYVAGTTYYLGNTAGALSTSAGTNSVVVGVGDADGNLVLRKATPSQVDAQQGGSTFGTPSSSNKFITQDYNSSATGLPVQNIYSTASTAIGSSTTQFDITNPSGTTFRYTYDSTGTDPNISSANNPVGSLMNIQAQNFNSANNGLFLITGSGTNYFEVTNASGVIESNKTIGTGYIVKSGTTVWTKPAGLKYITVEVVGGGGGGGGAGSSDNTTASGGGGGGYSKKTIAAASLNATEPYIVGDYGAGGASGANPGAAGKLSSFGIYLKATGGGAGTNPTGNAVVGGVGGIGTLGDLNVAGQPGGYGCISSTDDLPSGVGGGSFYGGGGVSVYNNSGSSGVAGRGYGGGGSGAMRDSSTNGAGGNGSAGVVIVTEYYS